MKGIVLLAVMACLHGFAFAEQTGSQGPKSVLVVYEESQPGIDAWRTLFREELAAANFKTDEKTAAEAVSSDPAKYDQVIIYGTVMAFTTKEPIRDWLEKKQTFSGRPVRLFVTANRWFLKEYHGKLQELLKKDGANVVDAVSAATAKLTDGDKRSLVHDFVVRLGN